MNRKTLLAMWATILLLVATWIYPPWIHSLKHGSGYTPDELWHPRVWASLFDTRQHEPYPDSLVFTIDYQRLFFVDAIIAAIGIGAFFTARKR